MRTNTHTLRPQEWIISYKHTGFIAFISDVMMSVVIKNCWMLTAGGSEWAELVSTVTVTDRQA